MANYNLVTTNTFQPFTYNDLAAPILAKEKEHEASELAAMTLQEQLADLQGVDLGSEERNTMLNDFKRSLDEVYNQLGESGITPDLSRKLQGLKKDYARDILPIIKKVDVLNLAEETRSKLISENPNIMFKHSLPTIGEAIDGAKIDQGYWDTGKITSSIEERVTPLITNLLSQGVTLERKDKYNDKLTAIKDSIRNSNTDFMPGRFNSDAIVNSVFNDLYQQEWLIRDQQESMQYNRDNRRDSSSKEVKDPYEFLKSHDAQGNLKSTWGTLKSTGEFVVVDHDLKESILSYYEETLGRDEMLRTPIFRPRKGERIENTRYFDFTSGVPEPRNPAQNIAAWRKLYPADTIRRISVTPGTSNLSFEEFVTDDEGNRVKVSFEGDEVDVNTLPREIQNFLAEHPEADILLHKDGYYVVEYHR